MAWVWVNSWFHMGLGHEVQNFLPAKNPYPGAVPVPMCYTHTLFGLYIPHRTIKIYNYCFILWYSDKECQREWVRVVWHNHLHVGCLSHLPLPSTTHLHLCNHTQTECVCVTCSTSWLPKQPNHYIPPLLPLWLMHHTVMINSPITKEKDREGRKGGRKKRRKEKKTGREENDSTR